MSTPTGMKRAAAIVTVLAAAIATLTITGCGPDSQPVTYAPAAYGVSGHCYYIDDPAEAIALENAGLCPHTWHPALMPMWWHEEYFNYYDSPAYYNRYVPVRVRTVYVTHERTFGTRYRTVIASRSKLATYRSSSGTLVKGTKMTGKTRFGSGTSFGTSGQRYGSGSLRNRSGSSSGSRTSSGSRSSGYRSGYGGGSMRSSGRR